MTPALVTAGASSSVRSAGARRFAGVGAGVRAEVDQSEGDEG